MKSFVYVEDKKVEFDIPPRWNVLYGKDINIPSPSEGIREKIKFAFEHPLGSPKIEDLAKEASSAIILFDDLTRPTPAYIVFSEILNRLNQGGISDDRITAICAVGTHPPPNTEELKKKIGQENFDRLFPRIYCHDALSKENVFIGRTSRGTPVEINPFVAQADLIVGIGVCNPHNWAGFGGGGKIIMPGICSFQSIASHHLAWLRNPNTHGGITLGNLFYEEINEIAQMVGLRFKVDFVLNFKGEIIQILCGHYKKVHEEGIRECFKLAGIHIPRKADITISSAYPLERGNQSIKSLTTAAYVTKTKGLIIWVAPQPDRQQLMPFVEEVASKKSTNEYHQQLLRGEYPEKLKTIGLSFMCTVVEVKSIIDRFSKIVHVTQGLKQSEVESMGMEYAYSIEDAISRVAKILPEADVIIFPFGGAILPIIKRE